MPPEVAGKCSEVGGGLPCTHTHRHTHIFNDLFSFLGSHLHTSKILLLYVNMDVALCHSSGAGNPFGRHGVKPHYSDTVQDLAGLYKASPWDMTFGLLEVEEIP